MQITGIASASTDSEKLWLCCGRDNCRAHKIILRIKKILGDTKKIREEHSKELCAAVGECMNILSREHCPKLCYQLIIEVMKLAFVEASTTFYQQNFSALHIVWKNGLTADETNKSNHSGCSDVIAVPKFLQRWIDDIERVQKQALPAYVSLLSFRKAHTDDKFDRAVEALVQCVESMTAREDAELVGRIAFLFIREVLNPLLVTPQIDANLKVALKHTEAAATLVCKAVRLNPAGALRDGQPALRALNELAIHVRQSHCLFQPQRDDASSKAFIRLLDAARDNIRGLLNALWQSVEPVHKPHMQEPYSSMVPTLAERPPRPLRLSVSSGWWVRASFVDHAGARKQFGGAVRDVCSEGQGIQVMLPAEVKSCVQNNGDGVDVAFKDGQAWYVSDVDMHLQLPDDDRIACKARAKRACVYKDTTGKPKGFCGMAFVIDNPDEQAVLKRCLEKLRITLPAGMVALPNRAPVLPAGLMRDDFDEEGLYANNDLPPSPDQLSQGQPLANHWLLRKHENWAIRYLTLPITHGYSLFQRFRDWKSTKQLPGNNPDPRARNDKDLGSDRGDSVANNVPREKVEQVMVTLIKTADPIETKGLSAMDEKGRLTVVLRHLETERSGGKDGTRSD